jgi:hypothetical protein
MRSEADIIQVTALTLRRLTFDLERLEQDPVWKQIRASQSILEEVPSIEETLRAFIQYHVVRDQFPHLTPGTNGPGDIDHIQLEIQCPQQL